MAEKLTDDRIAQLLVNQTKVVRSMCVIGATDEAIRHSHDTISALRELLERRNSVGEQRPERVMLISAPLEDMAQNGFTGVVVGVSGIFSVPREGAERELVAHAIGQSVLEKLDAIRDASSIPVLDVSNKSVS